MEVIKFGERQKGVMFKCSNCGCEFKAGRAECSKGRDIKGTEIGKEFYWTSACPNCGDICKGEEEEI